MAGNNKKKRINQPKIHHTSAATVDRDQHEALSHARKIFGSSGPEPIRKPHKKKK